LKKTKTALEHTIKTENHGHKKVALKLCFILAWIYHVEYVRIDGEAEV